MPMIKSIKHIFLDFDETLFNHRAFLDWTDDELHRLGHLPGGKGSFRGSIDKYHEIIETEPLLRLYKHQRHIGDTTSQTWPAFAKKITQLASQQKKDFCYPDAHKLIDYLTTLPQDLRLLTFGDDEYQRFKIATCPYLKAKGLTIHVVAEPKTEFLAKHFSKDEGVLVDDKYPLKLPKNWHHIWIDRQAGLTKPQKISNKETKISSLGQIKNQLFTSSA